MDLGSVGQLFVELGLKDRTKEGTDKASSRLQKFGKVLKPLGIGIAALGGALMACEARFKELNHVIERASIKSKISSDTLRDLAKSLANVDFPLQEVIDGMEALSIKGVENEKQMKRDLQAYDTVADALGITMKKAVNDVGTALELFGHELEEIRDKQDVFSYVMMNSTEGIEEFLYSFERLGVEIRESGMSLEEYASVYLILEEKGLKGRAAVKALREAINEADGDFSKMCEALGITTEELDKHSQGLQDATGLTLELDKAAEKSHTTFDKFKEKVDELRFSIGQYTEPFSFLIPALTSLGPVLMSVSMASQTWASINTGAVAPSLTAVTIAGAPLWVIIGAIAAAVLGLILVFKNWGKISDWIKRQISKIKGAFSSLREKIGSVKEKISKKLSGLKDKFTEFSRSAYKELGGFPGILEMVLLGPLGPLKKMWDQNWLGIRDTVTEALTGARTVVTQAMTAVREMTIGKLEDIVDYLKELPGKVYDHVKSAMDKIVQAIKDKAGEIKAAISDVIGKINPLNWDLPGLSPFLSAFQHAGELASEALAAGLKTMSNVEVSPQFNVSSSADFSKAQGGTSLDPLLQEIRLLRQSINSRSGETSIVFNVPKMVVREEQDIEKIGRQLVPYLERLKQRRK